MVSLREEALKEVRRLRGLRLFAFSLLVVSTLAAGMGQDFRNSEQISSSYFGITPR